MSCRFCQNTHLVSFLDLGSTPISNAFLNKVDLEKGEKFYPLETLVCETCWLVQIREVESRETHFNDQYAYFSSFSESWLNHAKVYAETAIKQWDLTASSLVVEAASNDGYLLQYFKAKNIPVLGIEPSGNVARVAESKGLPTHVGFFGKETAQALVSKGKQADLFIGNNVLAHVPDLNDFVNGLKIILKSTGVATFEFPHLLNLINENQFDTVYHEHYSYLSLIFLDTLFSHCHLKLFDCEKISTHGGSLRVYVCHADSVTHPSTSRLSVIKEEELRFGLKSLKIYQDYSKSVLKMKWALVEKLNRLKLDGAQIAAYGAAAKGNTLLNFCGIKADILSYCVDRSTFKQGKHLPGARVPIVAPDELRKTKPDYLLILPWNLKSEIMEQTQFVRDWGGKFLIPVPTGIDIL